MLSYFRKEHKKCEFQVHEVYAIDILMSSGEGKAKEKETRTTVYKRTEEQYSLKMKASRGMFDSSLSCKLELRAIPGPLLLLCLFSRYIRI